MAVLDTAATDGQPLAETRSLVIPKVAHAPRLQDFLAGSEREAEAVVTAFRQYEPADGAEVSQQTTAYLSYDDTRLFVVFVCRDAPGSVRASLANRENIESDDQVVVHLDTFHDRRHAYSFFSNPLGVQRDSRWTEGQGADVTFDAVWSSEGRLTPEGYVVWMAIPFKSLRFPRADAQRWGIALGRLIKRSNEMANWPYITQRIESYAGQFATLDGLAGISPGRNAQLIPYAASTLARFGDEPPSEPRTFSSEVEARVGLDAKVVMRDAIVLDVTANPDYSQVEPDAPQVTINQRFEVYFPERRPFFVENADMFQTPVNLFFTRRIRDPQLGTRLTTRLEPWTIAGMVVDDRAPASAEADRAATEHGFVGAARVQRAFRNQSTLGVLVTRQAAGPETSQVSSLDTRLRLGGNWVFAGQLIHTTTREANGQRLVGPGWWAEMTHTGLHLAYAARYSDFSPEFRAPLGFVPRVDIRQGEQYVRYYWRPNRGPVLLFGPDVTLAAIWNHRGQLQDHVVDASFGADLKGATGAGCRHVNRFERFEGLEFHHARSDCGVNTSWLRWLQLSADYAWGTAVNYYPPPGVAPIVASSRSTTLTVTFRPNARLTVAQTYLGASLGGDVSTPATAGSGPVFDDRIWRSKVTYQFTQRLSWRGIVDYHGFSADASQVMLEPGKTLTADLLLTYLVNPWTVVYLGYVDRYDSPREAAAPLGFRHAPAPDMSTARQFFAKVSYLLQF